MLLKYKYTTHIKILLDSISSHLLSPLCCSVFKYLAVFLLSALVGCTKLVEVDPPFTSTNASNVYSTDQTAIAVLNGIYTRLGQGGIVTGANGLSSFCGLSADEFGLYDYGSIDFGFASYYKNTLTSTLEGYDFWNDIYHNIFKCNSAIEGLEESTTLTPAIKQQLLGESKFLRAFFYFYLTNLYGGVPLTTSTDYKINSQLKRATKDEVYEQIISDLNDAKGLLSENYLDGFLQNYRGLQERVRPSKWAAVALLARVYLYAKAYAAAENEATELIEHSVMFQLSSIDNAFFKNSSESIWQLQPVNFGWNTEDARLFIIPSTGLSATHPIYLSASLVNSFETGDLRKSFWVNFYKDTSSVPNVDYYYPYKYKSATQDAEVTEYLTLLRLGELFLIRSEARANLNSLPAALNDLNQIRGRAGLPQFNSDSKEEILNAVFRERRVELFSELGHRWFDIKRTNTVDAIMSVESITKGSSWNSNWQWYPLPLADIQKNGNLVQNPGY